MTEEFQREVHNKFPHIDIIGEYVDARTKVQCRCKLCGETSERLPNNILRKKYGCVNCGDDGKRLADFREMRGVSPEDFAERVKAVNPHITVLGSFENMNKKILVHCSCGNTWNAHPTNLTRPQIGCPKCSPASTSFVEQVIRVLMCDLFGEDAVTSRNTTLIGMELDVAVAEKNIAIEYGAWYWHQEKLESDAEKRKRCADKGVKCTTVYDSFAGDEMPQDENVLVYTCNLGSPKHKDQLLEMLNRLLKMTGEDKQLSMEELEDLVSRVNEAMPDQATEAFVEKIDTERLGIKIIGKYRNQETKITTQCTRCGHTWEANPNTLRQATAAKAQESTCPACIAEERRLKAEEHTKQEFIKTCWNIEFETPYVDVKTKIRVRCKDCGEISYIAPKKVYKSCGCRHCRKKQKKEAA